MSSFDECDVLVRVNGCPALMSAMCWSG